MQAVRRGVRLEGVMVELGSGDSLQNLIGQALALKQSGQMDAAQSILVKARKLYPAIPDVAFLLAHLSLTRNVESIDQVRQRHEMVCQIDLAGATKYFYQSNQFMNTVVNSLKDFPHSASVENTRLADGMLERLYLGLVSYGQTCLCLVDYDRARDYFDQAVALLDGRPEAHFARGELAYRLCEFSQCVDCFNESLRRRDFNTEVKPVAPKHLYIIGYASSGTMILYQYIMSIFNQKNLYYCQEQRLLNSITHNFQTINPQSVVSSTDWHPFPHKERAVTLSLDKITPFISCGWTHVKPDLFRDTAFYRNTRLVYVHRDGRDAVASHLTAYALSENVDMGELTPQTPGHFGCRASDMAHCLSDILHHVRLWLDNVMSYCRNRADFLEVRFEDISSDSRGTGRQADVVLTLGKYVGVDLNVESDVPKILQDVATIQSGDKAVAGYRPGYRKIGRHLEFFGEEEIQLCNAMMGMGLVLLDYMSVEAFSKTICNTPSFTLRYDPSEIMMRGWAGLFFQTLGKDVVVECLDDTATWKPGVHYMIFSPNKVTIPEGVMAEYFPFYRLFFDYNPKIFNLVERNFQRLAETGKNGIVIISSEKNDALNVDMCDGSVEAVWLQLLKNHGHLYEVQEDHWLPSGVETRPVLVISHPVSENNRVVSRLLKLSTIQLFSTYPFFGAH